MFQKNNVKAQKLLIVDTDVLDSEILLADLQSDFRTIRLSRETDPVLQISQALFSHQPVREIVLLAHANPGKIHFTDYVLDLTELDSRKDELRDWRNWVTDDARLSIYACQLASNETGRAFIQELGNLTGIAIAASSQPIGNMGTHRNWHLDRFTQPFEVPVPFSKHSLAEYPHQLAPVITFNRNESVLAVTEGASGGRYLEFVVTLSEPATSAVRIYYRTLDDASTATGEVDYNEASSYIDIAAGRSSGTISVYVYGDNADEVDESVVLELYNPSNAVFPDGANTLRATGVILDDDGTANNRALFVSQVQVVEGNDGSQQAVFEVQLSRPSTDSITLSYTTTDGSALAGQDYQATAGTLTFLPGETLKTVAVPVIGDTVAEANEFFNLVFTPTAAIANGVDGAVGTAVILDDDTSASLPEISLSGASTIEGASGGKYLEFVVTLSEPATSAVRIYYRTLDDASTATGEVDYNEASSYIDIAAGRSSGTISVYVYGDNADEVDESVVLELYNPSNAVFPDGANTLRATGVILDDDGTANNRALFVSQVQVVEGNDGSQQAVFEVQLSRPSTDSITLSYTTTDGSALAGQDYQATAGTLTFLPGETLKTVAVPVIGDTVAEANEFFNLVFTPTAAIANGVDGAVGTAVILDDDTSASLPEISLSGASTIEGASGGKYLEFVVTLSEPATSAVRIYYRTLDDASTATGEVDYNEASSYIDIAAGRSSGTISVYVYGDNADEVDESVVLELYNPSNAVFPDGANMLRATGVILDDDGTANNRALFVSQVQVVEGNDGSQQAVFEVQLSRPSTDSITLSYTTTDGSALAGQDYQATAGTLTFLPGETLKTVAVPVIGDTVAEANEFFNLVFTPTAAIANGVDGAVGTAVILDDDTSASLPEISLSGASTIEGASGGKYLEFVVTLSEPATSAVRIYYRTLDDASTATGEVDYNEASSYIDIAAGRSSGTISVYVYGDNADEVDESVVLELYNPSNAVFPDGANTLRATGVILDDDGTANNRALFVSQVQVVEGNDGSQQAVFEVQLSRPSTDSITLSYTTTDGSALAGQDYQATAGTLTFLPGETLKTVAVPVIGDTVAEANEFFNLVFTPTAAIANGVDGAVGTAVILDDDTSASLPEISLSGASTIEGASGGKYLEFVVTLSEPATSAVRIYYRTLDDASTATGEVDYNEASSYIDIAAGRSSGTISVYVYGDNADEVDESVVLELYNPSNAVFPDGANTLRATGVILDDDGTANNRALFVSQVQVVEGNDGSQQAVFEVQLSRPSTDSITLSYTTTDGSALAGQDYQATAGTLTFLPGETLKTVAVPVIGDTVAEANEFFNLVFTPTAAIANGVDGAVGTAVILDDDTSASLPEISLSGASTIEGASGGKYLEFVVTLSEPATSAVRIYYRTLDDASTATGEVDYNEASSYIDIAAGRSSGTISVYVYGDNADEVDESVVLELYNPSNAVFPDGVNTLQAIGSILDDDGAGNNRGLFVGNAEIVEGADGVTREVAVPVHLSRPSDQTLTFLYQTADGSATAGQDYIPQTGSVTFLPGQTLAAVIIPIIGDAIDEPSETFTLTVTPTAAIANGSDGATGTVTILDGDVVAPPPPAGVTVNAGGNATISEGSLFSRTITFIDDIDTNADGWTYSVNWGDGSAIETGSIVAGANSFDISRFFADGDAGHDVSVTVTDVAGDSDTQQFRVNVNNVAPVIALSGLPEVNAGVSYTLNLGAITDPGDDTVISYIVNWGDGSSDTYDVAGEVTHIYSTAGSNIITVDLIDEDGTHTNASSLAVAVTVPAAGVSMNAGIDAVINEGSLFTRTITFSDGEDAGANGWTYSVNWGDGSVIETGSIAVGFNSFDISHFFVDGDANHDVSVTVTDVAGDSDTQQFRVNVNNVAPTIALSGLPEVDAGVSYTLNLGAITDPGDDTVISYIVNWGDGSSDIYDTAGEVIHTFAAEGNYTISVDLVDEDDTHTAAGTLAVAVNSVIIPDGVSVNAGINAIIDEGSVFTRTITFSDGEDAGADGWTYSVNWGDGSTIETGSIAAGANSFDISHFFADGDVGHDVSVTVTDVAGDSDTQQFRLNVNNVAPTLSIAGADDIDEGGIYVLAITATDPAGAADPLTYSIDWGDGSSLQSLTAAELAALGGNVEHIYVDDEDGPVNATPRTITVTANDGDGGVTQQSRSVTVHNVAPTLAVSGAASQVQGTAYALTLGAVTDPGIDTVTSYIVNWGDGNISSYDSAGEVSHIYASTGDFVITVDLIDEDGTHTEVATQAVAVTAPTPTLSFEAGADVTLDEGTTFTRTIVFSDGEDNGAIGWGYTIDYGDGTIDTGTTLVQSLELSHLYADGDATHTVTVTLTDEAGEAVSDNFTVQVDDVAPVIALSGLPEVDAGVNYILNLGAITDPGDDTVISYIVNWGDGSSNTYDAAGEVTHTFAAEGNYTISVDLVDEDDTHTAAGTLAVAVNPVIIPDGVSVNAGTDAVIDEGSFFTRTITFADGEDTGADGWTYSVDWGNDSVIETGSIAAGANSFDISRFFADGDASHDISVMVTDVAGDSDTQQFRLDVNNVAPTIALSGLPEVDAGVSYTLNLGAITDPGDDTVTSYIVNWGDDSSDIYDVAGEVTHTFAAKGNYTISVDLVDEDGTHADAGNFAVTVNEVAPVEVVRIGDAPLLVLRSNPNAWQDAWTDEIISISHKSDYTNAGESWSSAVLNGVNPSALAGGDIFGGDLGVSGQSLKSSSIAQEIDGTEALRFDLAKAATGVTVDLSRLEGNTEMNQFDAGRLQLLDDSGLVVNELVFSANTAGHEQQITLEHSAGFLSVVLTAGIYEDGQFIFGGLADASGAYQSSPVNPGNGSWDGSDYLVSAIEFEFGNISLVGVQGDLGLIV